MRVCVRLVTSYKYGVCGLSLLCSASVFPLCAVAACVLWIDVNCSKNNTCLRAVSEQESIHGLS